MRLRQCIVFSVFLMLLAAAPVWASASDAPLMLDGSAQTCLYAAFLAGK